ncbi:RING finger protein 141-like isoform X2 [Lingula anatina]|nr:RING finger protein 141-like isoform X2 [Lingula anatina]|eukprot:XP_013410899.1 RING finger protein 141-like isoform X2 [Lingula anatina]
MGQGQSLRENVPSQVVWVHDKLRNQASQLKEIAALSYEEFLEAVRQVNEITEAFTDDTGKKLVFQVKPGTDSTLLWKAAVRIRCMKVMSESGHVESTRILNIKQFVRLYHEIIAQAESSSLNTDPKRTALTASIILSEADSLSCASEEANECIICMERKADVILPCAHLYCEQCIDRWSVSSHTCPVCRATVSSTDETWVLTEKPDSSQMASEMKGYVLGLADRVGKPQTEDDEDDEEEEDW